MIWRISFSITKLVLLWENVFSAHDLHGRLNGKMFHMFVRAKLLLYGLVSVKSQYVVRGTTPIAYSMCSFYTCCDIIFTHMMVRIDTLRIPCARFLHML